MFLQMRIEGNYLNRLLESMMLLSFCTLKKRNVRL